MAAALARFTPQLVDLRALARSDGLSCLADAGLLVVGPRAASLAPSEETIRAVRATLPHLPIYLVSEVGKSLAAGLPSYVKAGVDDVVLAYEGEISPPACAAMAARLLLPVPELEMHVLLDAWGRTRASEIAFHYVRNSVLLGIDHRERRYFGLTRRRVADLLRTADLPAPNTLVRVGRHFHARHLVRSARYGQDEIARRVGFGDSSTMRSSRWRLKKYLNRSRSPGVDVLQRLLFPSAL